MHDIISCFNYPYFFCNPFCLEDQLQLTQSVFCMVSLQFSSSVCIHFYWSFTTENKLFHQHRCVISCFLHHNKSVLQFHCISRLTYFWRSYLYLWFFFIFCTWVCYYSCWTHVVYCAISFQCQFSEWPYFHRPSFVFHTNLHKNKILHSEQSFFCWSSTVIPIFSHQFLSFAWSYFHWPSSIFPTIWLQFLSSVQFCFWGTIICILVRCGLLAVRNNNQSCLCISTMDPIICGQAQWTWYWYFYGR